MRVFNKYFIKSLTWVLAFLPLSSGSLSHADAKRETTSCPVRFVKMLNRKIPKSGPTMEELERIAEIFENESISPRQRAEKAFGICLKARLRDVDPKIAGNVLRAVDSSVVERTWGVLDKSGAILDDSRPGFVGVRLRLSIPYGFEESILHYATLMHEVEHAIQILSLNREASFSAVEIGRLFHQVRGRYQMEKGAIQASLEFLKTIPEVERRSVLAQIENTTKMHPFTRKVLTALIEGSFQSLGAGTRRNQRVSHYTFVQLLWALDPYGVAAGVVGAGTAGVLGPGILNGVCKSLRESQEQEPGSALERFICVK